MTRTPPVLIPVVLLLAACAAKPPLPPPPPPPFLAFTPEETLPAPVNDVSATEQRAEAADYPLDERNLRQNLIQLFAYRVRAANVPGFNLVYGNLDDSPVWLTVSSRPPIDRTAYLELAAPELRQHVGFRESAFDKSLREAAQERLAQALPPESGFCLLAFAAERDRFDLVIEEGRDIEDVRKRLPADLVPLVDVVEGGCPVPA